MGFEMDKDVTAKTHGKYNKLQELHLERGRIEFCFLVIIFYLMMASLFLTDVLFIQEHNKSDQLLLQLKINMGAG